jgi:hypothetical protein
MDLPPNLLQYVPLWAIWRYLPPLYRYRRKVVHPAKVQLFQPYV